MRAADEYRGGVVGFLAPLAKWGFAVAGVLFFVGVTLMFAWPAGSAAHNDLRAAYGDRTTRLTTLHVTPDSACGYYRAIAGREFKYFSTPDGLWAEQLSPVWLAKGDLSEPNQKWQDCMDWKPRKGGFVDAIGASLTLLFLRLA